MQSPTWSSPSRSSRIASCGSHATTWPFVKKTPISSTRFHSIPHHSNRRFPTIFELLPFTPWPCITSSSTCAFLRLWSYLFRSKFSSLPTSSSPFAIFFSFLSSFIESDPNSPMNPSTLSSKI